MNIESTLRADRIWRNVIRGAGLFLLITTADGQVVKRMKHERKVSF